MRRIMLALALLGFMGCASITVVDDGETVGVLAETSRLFGGNATELRKEAEKAACPDGTFQLSQQSIQPEDLAKLLNKAAANGTPASSEAIREIGVFADLVNAVDKLHESVKGWLGRRTVKLNGSCVP